MPRVRFVYLLLWRMRFARFSCGMNSMVDENGGFLSLGGNGTIRF